MSRCIHCKYLQKTKSKDCIGICKKYGIVAKDSLSGCKIVKSKKKGAKADG